MTSGQHAIMGSNVTEHFEKYSGSMLRRLALSCLLSCVVGLAHAEETLAQDPAQEAVQEAAQEATQEAAVVFNLEGSSDQQIGVLLQRWPKLDATQRRDLLAEVRKRMRTAAQAQEAQGESAIRSKTPSLTLRIKRAQTRHGYGRPTPRGDAEGNSDQLASVDGSQRPRELVIRTTVTQVLPDGSRITRQETLLPSSLSAEMAKQGRIAGLSSGDSLVHDSQNNPSGKMRVRRTTVRFGAGFHRRHEQGDSPAAFESGVRRISTPDAPSGPAEVVISAPIPAIGPEAK